MKALLSLQGFFVSVMPSRSGKYTVLLCPEILFR